MRTIDRSTGSLIVVVGLILGVAVAGGAAEHVGRPLPSKVTAELAESLATMHRVLPSAGDADPSGGGQTDAVGGQLAARQDHPPPLHQRQEKLQPGDVEGDRGHRQERVGGVKTGLPRHRLQEVDQRTVGDLDALGLAGRARGVDDVGEVRGRRRGRRALRRPGGDGRALGVETDGTETGRRRRSQALGQGGAPSAI